MVTSFPRNTPSTVDPAEELLLHDAVNASVKSTHKANRPSLTRAIAAPLSNRRCRYPPCDRATVTQKGGAWASGWLIDD